MRRGSGLILTAGLASVISGCASPEAIQEEPPLPKLKPVVQETAPISNFGTLEEFAIDLYNEGNTLRDEGKMREALQKYSLAAGVLPGFTEAWLNKANTHKELGDRHSAVRAYGHLMDIRPDLAQPAYEIGRMYIEEENFRTAEGYLERAIQLDPEHSHAHVAFAGVQTALGDKKKAVEHLDTAFNLAPDDTYVLLIASQLYRLMGEDKKAKMCENQFKLFSQKD